MASALQQFFVTEGRLPVQGTIPDMISMPEYYVRLQRIYLEKSNADITLMRGLCFTISEALNNAGQAVAQVNDDDLTMFVRNCLQIEVLKMRTISEETENPDWSADVADEMFDNECHGPRWLIAMKAFEACAAKSADPANFGEDQANLATELAALKVEAKTMTDAMG